MTTTARYGAWPSPLSAELIAAGTVGLAQVAIEPGALYWIEARPVEGGRNVIVGRDRAGIRDLLPPPYDARTRVHEYGGGSYAVSAGTLYFSNYSDHRLYRLAPGAAPVAITPAGARRYADMVVDQRRKRLLCVMEDHGGSGPPVNCIVDVDTNGQRAPTVLIGGSDFYAAPRLSPDGRYLAWLAWNQPNMPWDATELYRAQLTPDGALGGIERVAGGVGESVFQPTFAPDGTLYYVSDRSGWWNLYSWRDGAARALAPMEAEFGVPQWVFGQSMYAFAGADQIVASCVSAGVSRLMLINTSSGVRRALDVAYTDIGYVQAHAGRAAFVAAGPTQLPAVVELDLASGRRECVQSSTTLCLEPGYLARAQPFAYETTGGTRAYAFYYPPHNHDVDAPADEKPPLLVCAHGGPTAAASSALNLKLQYWTSRGFAVLDVNYRGSSGYGRAYRDALNGLWGIADVDDCIHGARHLVGAGQADGARAAIRGGSAGGYTALCAATFHDFFSAGASYYGISDLEALARDTHKFEARYLDRLVGPYPQRRACYRDRSSLYHVHRLGCPMIFFQGLDDQVVPRNQTELMVEALRSKGIPVAYVAFPGERHGFRQAENIKRALEAELYFYGRLFGFVPSDRIDPVPISNFA